MRTKDMIDKVLVLIFSAVLLFWGAFILLKPVNDFSHKENRPLAGLPTFTLSGIMEGKYFEELSTFYKDQFPLRDLFTSVCSTAQLTIGRIEIGGVIPLANNKFVAVPSYNDLNVLEENIKTIENFTKDGNSFLYIPPRAIDIFNDSLPSIYDRTDIDKPLKLIPYNTLKLFNEFIERSDNSSYYATDHHWTTDGAYLGYTQLASILGITAYPKDSFDIQTASNEFYGTSYSSSALPRYKVIPDTVKLYRYNGDELINIKNNETNTESRGFYDLQAIEQKDKYKVFLGGNYSHLSILNTSPKEKLLLIKDSFANSLVPFLALHYDIEMLDPRYCSGELLNSMLYNGDFDKVLFVLSLDTLISTNIKAP